MFLQMLGNKVNFDFSIMKKLWDLAHEKLISIIGNFVDLESKVQISSVTKQKKFIKTIMKIITKINNDYLHII